MSIDSSGAAETRVEAASEEASWRDDGASLRALADIASSIERVAASIAAEAVPAADGTDALERIADVAFVLHERDVEATLCDALDAAVRDLGNDLALKQTSAERARRAAASLRALARRVNDMIARRRAEQGIERSSAANSVVAASPPSFGEPDESESAAGQAADGQRSVEAELAQPQVLPGPDEDPGDLFEPTSGDFATDHAKTPLHAREPPNEPAARPEQTGAPLGECAAELARPAAPPPPVTAGFQPRSQSAAPPHDPLAPLHALSEDELIALFS